MMKLAIESQIHEMEGKLSGYVTLLVYRYANLCVKAQPLSLLSAIIEDEEQGELKLEETAGVLVPDEYHLKLVPYNPRFNFPLCKAIMKEHPEFKQELVKPENTQNEDDRYLILTMPEVNKDRHDALTDAVGVLYDGCKAQIDKTVASYRMKLESEIVALPTDDEREEVQNALDSSAKSHQGIIDTVKADKLKEIDESYQRYLDGLSAKKTEADEEAAARGETAGQEYRMDNHE